MELYNQWKHQSSKDRKKTEHKNDLFRVLLKNAREAKIEFQAANPKVDAMLQVTTGWDSDPLTRLGQTTQGVLQQIERNPMDTSTILSFFGDILSEDVTQETLYKYHQP